MNPPASNLQQKFQAALALHQGGKFPQAEAEYRKLLATDETFAPAWHMLGVLLMQTGRLPQAIDHIRRAIALGLAGGGAHNNLGEALRASGHLDESIAEYQLAIMLDSNAPSALANLATAYTETGRFAEAIPYFQKSLSSRPNDPKTLHHYSIALRNTGQPESAIETLERITRIAPDYLPALTDLAETLHRSQKFDRAQMVLNQLLHRYPRHAPSHATLARVYASIGRFDDALTSAQKAIELDPNSATNHIVLGLALMHVNRIENAIASYRQAISLDPKSHIAYANLGGALSELNRTTEAIESLKQAVQLNLDDADVVNSLAGAYYIARQPEKALETIDRAITRHPLVPVLHRSRSVALFALGRYLEGWDAHEWRWRMDAPQHNPQRNFDRPLWDGSDPAGRKILVHSEQGYGDVIQFARYVPMLAAADVQVILEVPAPVRDLLGSLRCKAQIIPKGVKLPDFDLHIPLMSLPRIYQTTLDSIPALIPYLFATASRIEKFRTTIPNHADNKLKVGLVWAGNAIPDPRRTIPSQQIFTALSAIPNISWFSLQTGEHVAELKNAPASMNVLDLSPQLKDFADTAAVISQLDLIITIDTSTAHLAGALGAKTWTLLTAGPDWRWGSEGKRSLWYPTMRLFRQTVLGDWTPVLSAVAHELTAPHPGS